MKRFVLGMALSGITSVGFADEQVLQPNKVSDLNDLSPPLVELPDESHEKLMIALAKVDKNFSKITEEAKVVFGVELGKPVSFQHCDRSANIYNLKTPCFDKRLVLPRIIFPYAELPSFVKDKELNISLYNNNIEEIQINTDGIKTQDEILKTLEAKYGIPFYFKILNSSTMMGIEFEHYNAAWITPSVTIRFSSVTGKIDEGVIIFITKRYDDHRRKHIENQKTKERPL